MAKHRGTVFAVVRQGEEGENVQNFAARPVLIGVYFSLERAEEIAGKSTQQFKDMNIEGYRFEVQPTTYYDE